MPKELYARLPNVTLPRGLRQRTAGGGNGDGDGDGGAQRDKAELHAHVAAAVDSSSAVDAKLKDKVLLLDNRPPRAVSDGGAAAASSSSAAAAANTQAATLPRAYRESSAKRRRRQCKPLTSREKHRLGVHRLPKRMEYAALAPLRDAWRRYAAQLLCSPDAGGANEKQAAAAAVAATGDAMLAGDITDRVLRMDLHGAYVEIARSTAPEQVGWGGVVVQETENVLRVVTPADKLRALPKRQCDFVLYVPARRPAQQPRASDAGQQHAAGREPERCAHPERSAAMNMARVVVHGAMLAVRSAERSVRKPKRRPDSTFTG